MAVMVAEELVVPTGRHRQRLATVKPLAPSGDRARLDDPNCDVMNGTVVPLWFNLCEGVQGKGKRLVCGCVDRMKFSFQDLGIFSAKKRLPCKNDILTTA